MGIFIHTNILDTITRDEWREAYQKSVRLMKKMPLYRKWLNHIMGQAWCA